MDGPRTPRIIVLRIIVVVVVVSARHVRLVGILVFPCHAGRRIRRRDVSHRITHLLLPPRIAVDAVDVVRDHHRTNRGRLVLLEESSVKGPHEILGGASEGGRSDAEGTQITRDDVSRTLPEVVSGRLPYDDARGRTGKGIAPIPIGVPEG